MNTSTIKSSLFNWLNTEFGGGLTPIFARQNSPRPQKPYATIQLQSLSMMGQDELRSIDDSGIATIGGQRKMTIDLNIYGPDALGLMHQAQSSLSKQSVLDAFYESEIAIWNVGDAKDLTALLETNWEERAQMDVFIGFANNINDDLGIIEKVDLSGQINNTTIAPFEIAV